jgi:hypothetical protein
MSVCNVGFLAPADPSDERRLSGENRLGSLADQVAVAALLGIAAIHQPKGAASVDYVARSNLARLRAPLVFTPR